MGQIIKVAGIAGAVTLVLGTAVLADLSANTHDEKPTATATVTATATPTAQPTATVAPKPTATPTAKPAAVKAPACEEDQPCWDCKTMGNRVCGPTSPATIPANLAAPVKATPAKLPVSATAKKVTPATENDMVAPGNVGCDGRMCADVNTQPKDATGYWKWDWSTGWVHYKTFVEPYVPGAVAEQSSGMDKGAGIPAGVKPSTPEQSSGMAKGSGIPAGVKPAAGSTADAETTWIKAGYPDAAFPVGGWTVGGKATGEDVTLTSSMTGTVYVYHQPHGEAVLTGKQVDEGRAYLSHCKH